MLNKYELIGCGIAVFLMAAALYLIEVDTHMDQLSQAADRTTQLASAGLVVVEGDTKEATEVAVKRSIDQNGKLKNMVIDDVKIGTGEAVEQGDTVSVHYVGTLQNGQEFDNSRKRGEPFSFKVGAGQVIQGWEEGLVGMQVGGQRILVIPPELAYGDATIGPIPASSTLIFAIELVEIK